MVRPLLLRRVISGLRGGMVSTVIEHDTTVETVGICIVIYLLPVSTDDNKQSLFYQCDILLFWTRMLEPSLWLMIYLACEIACLKRSTFNFSSCHLNERHTVRAPALSLINLLPLPNSITLTLANSSRHQYGSTTRSTRQHFTL